MIKWLIKHLKKNQRRSDASQSGKGGKVITSDQIHMERNRLPDVFVQNIHGIIQHGGHPHYKGEAGNIEQE